MITFILFLIILFPLELIYFKIAEKHQIIDKPNHRSSHNVVTIRGGGIIFSIALLLSPISLGWPNVYFLTGLLLISAISFFDDIKTLNSGVRILFHLAAVALLFYQVNIYNLPLILILISFFVAIGTINAINFMDGINGITGIYGLVACLSLYYINRWFLAFTSEVLLLIAIAALLVFLYFNFRTRAKCFAGDVGSVSIAFIITFFITQLIIKTGNVNYILLLLVYGLDTATTILFRFIRKEKISEAHRSHFYQFLVNEKKMSHLLVASIYGAIQIIFNFFLIKYHPESTVTGLIIILISTSLFVGTRFIFEGKSKLFLKNGHVTDAL